jgi:hypothetical protein
MTPLRTSPAPINLTPEFFQSTFGMDASTPQSATSPAKSPANLQVFHVLATLIQQYLLESNVTAAAINALYRGCEQIWVKLIDIDIDIAVFQGSSSFQTQLLYRDIFHL